jgi:hypothetical protein
MNPHIQKIIAREIDKALQRHGLSDATPIRNELQARAKPGQGYNGVVRIQDESGGLISIDHAIDERPPFSALFPARSAVRLSRRSGSNTPKFCEDSEWRGHRYETAKLLKEEIHAQDSE